MVEAKNDMRSTKLVLLGAMAWIWRATSELRVGYMEEQEGHLGYAIRGELGAMTVAGTA
jgi:hypothetical protein